MDERAERARRLFEVPILIAALLVVPVIIIEEQATSPAWQSVAVLANWTIWAAFLVEYLVVVTLAERKWHYTKKAWLDIFIIVTSFPVLPGLLDVTRLGRLIRLTRVLRILRLARLAAVLTRGGTALRLIFRKRGLGYLTFLVLLVAMGFGGIFFLVEPGGRSLQDSLWWAIVTLTTVGYGDIFPETTAGRAVGVALMLVGIGFVALLTAAIAAHFVEDEDGTDSDQLRTEIRNLNQRLDTIEALLRGRGPL